MAILGTFQTLYGGTVELSTAYVLDTYNGWYILMMYTLQGVYKT